MIELGRFEIATAIVGLLLISACAHKAKTDNPVAPPKSEESPPPVADFGDGMTTDPLADANAAQSPSPEDELVTKFKTLRLEPKADVTKILAGAGYKRLSISLGDVRLAKIGDICVTEDRRNLRFSAIRLKNGWRSASGRKTAKFPYRYMPNFDGCYRGS